MYAKDITKVSNPKHFRIMTEIQCVTFHEVTYIPGEANVLADALSRLTRHLRVEGRELENIKPRILGLSSCRARRARQMMHTDYRSFDFQPCSNKFTLRRVCEDAIHLDELVP